MANPYRSKPATAFWSRSVASVHPDEVDLVTSVPFALDKSDRIATAGSCFAQHISRTLASEGYNYIVTETQPRTAGAIDEGFGAYPARFANLYTTTQLRQLFERAYGLFSPVDEVWNTKDGAFIDPFRPRIQEGGFATADACREDTEAHLAAVREMFEQCDVFIFTLGLTEAWRSKVDKAVFPLAPGVVAEIETENYEFVNYDVNTVVGDLEHSIRYMREINPAMRIILTVSPVPLIATYEDRHVLVSTTLSKAVLRVAADMVAKTMPDVAYFPSYEMITGSYRRAEFYADDLREVLPEGVAHVMGTFKRHYLSGGATISQKKNRAPKTQSQAFFKEPSDFDAAQRVLCEEEAIESSLQNADH